MNAFGQVDRSAIGDDPALMSCRAALRAATQAPHERLHHHAGFARVKDGTISLPEYRALLIRLYGFYRPFDRAVGNDTARTRWLARDLAWLGVTAAALAQVRFCTDIPPCDTTARKLGALYVIEGSALGGRQLYRGLDRLFGQDGVDGRRFFAGRGTGTGAAWTGYLHRLAAVGADRVGRAAAIDAAIETFAVFEHWLGGWSETR
jgi:heme oxygenase